MFGAQYLIFAACARKAVEKQGDTKGNVLRMMSFPQYFVFVFDHGSARLTSGF